ncbi:MAG: zinc transporter ZupT [Ignavibacteriales bacterium]|nr:zinc transporter ZupT [Ignavibacteriales bacterium]
MDSIDFHSFAVAFGLTLFAGLATGVGSVIAIFSKRTNTKFLAVALGFSAGVMLYVSLVEIFFKAKDAMIAGLGEVGGSWATVAAFFGGVGVIALIDKFVPSHENPHEMRRVEEIDRDKPRQDYSRLMRTGTFTALAIAIHNFPEGLATFTAALKDPTLGVAIAVAIAIHNVPEGIAVSVPVYFATNDKKRAFWLSFLSGLAEPVGALIGFLVIYQFMNDVVFGAIFAGVAGIMVYISLDELLPAAEEYGEHHYSIFGVVAGMLVMAVSLLLFI